MCAKEKYTGFRGLAKFESKSLLCQISARTQGELCKPQAVKTFHAMVWHWQQTGISDYFVFSCLGSALPHWSAAWMGKSQMAKLVWQMQSGPETLSEHHPDISHLLPLCFNCETTLSLPSLFTISKAWRVAQASGADPNIPCPRMDPYLCSVCPLRACDLCLWELGAAIPPPPEASGQPSAEISSPGLGPWGQCHLWAAQRRVWAFAGIIPISEAARLKIKLRKYWSLQINYGIQTLTINRSALLPPCLPLSCSGTQ